jgi:hypothetical protein
MMNENENSPNFKVSIADISWPEALKYFKGSKVPIRATCPNHMATGLEIFQRIKDPN